MPEVLEGSQPGITVEEGLNIAADAFGYKVANTRFANEFRRAYNRALLDIWLDNPEIRRFKVHDAPVTLIAGTEVYDVRRDAGDGGWGWTKCCEVITTFFGTIRLRQMERISLEDFRYRQLNYSASGPPEGMVMLDNFRVRIFPAPDQAYEGTGDYFQEVPYITAGKVDWPAGWDHVALLGAEYYIARVKRPELANGFKTDYLDAMPKIRRSDSGHEKPNRAKMTRRYSRRIGLPHDNSTDLRIYR